MRKYGCIRPPMHPGRPRSIHPTKPISSGSISGFAGTPGSSVTYFFKYALLHPTKPISFGIDSGVSRGPRLVSRLAGRAPRRPRCESRPAKAGAPTHRTTKDIPTILCVLSDFGAAHRVMAKALEERLGGRFRIEVIDLIETTNRFCNDSLKLYAPILRRFPRFYNFFYAANAHRRVWDFFYETFLHRLMLDRVVEVIRESRPDCVLSLCALTSRITADALEAMGRQRDVPLIVHVVDLCTIHPIWAEARAALSLVPTAEAADALESMGVDRRTIRIVRYPLRRMFLEAPAPRESLRAGLGISGRGPVALVMGGGDGVLETEKAVRALFEADPAAAVIAVAGRNERLCGRLDALAKRSGRALTVLGFRDDIAGLMDAADLLVTKAGPSTIMEAVQREIPMVLTGFVPAQEAGNVDYVRSRGMGIYLDAARLGEAGALLRDAGRLRAMRKAIREEKRALPDLDSSEQIEQYLRS